MSKRKDADYAYIEFSPVSKGNRVRLTQKHK
jgi:hypothetical protein